MANFIALAVNGNRARAADIDHTQLTTFEEIGYAQLFADFATHRDGFGHWHNAANNDAVDVAVDHGVFICDKHFFDQKLITQPLSVQGFRMRTMDALSYVHIYLQ